MLGAPRGGGKESSLGQLLGLPGLNLPSARSVRDWALRGWLSSPQLLSVAVRTKNPYKHGKSCLPASGMWGKRLGSSTARGGRKMDQIIVSGLWARKEGQAGGGLAWSPMSLSLHHAPARLTPGGVNAGAHRCPWLEPYLPARFLKQQPDWASGRCPVPVLVGRMVPCWYPPRQHTALSLLRSHTK